MSKNAFSISALIVLALASPNCALADDWTGQASPTTINGPAGPATFPGKAMTTEQVTLICIPSSLPPPCTPGNQLAYNFTGNGTTIAALPANAAAASSNVGVNFSGYYQDPSSPSGLSLISGTLPLNAFARSATVDALTGTVGGLSTSVSTLNSTVGALGTSFNGLTTTVNGLSTSVTSLNSTVGALTTSLGALNSTVNVLSGTVGGLQTSVGTLNSTVGSLSTSFNALSSTVGTLGTSVSALFTNVNAMSAQLNSLSVQFTQLQQQAQLQDRDLRQGVAMSLAMDGVGDLGPDEHVAISMNFGTFGGQNGMAAGIAFRASDHLTVNGGIGSGVNGGLVGGRVGARFAW